MLFMCFNRMLYHVGLDDVDPQIVEEEKVPTMKEKRKEKSIHDPIPIKTVNATNP